MKCLAALLFAALVAGCAKSPQPIASNHFGFSIDQYIAVALEYQGPRSLIGADTYGPTEKEFECVRSDAAGIAQSDDMLPHGSTLVTTCLHVKFGGPLPKGAVAILPEVRGTFEYVTVGVEYGYGGGFVGAETLHIAPDRPTCLKEAHDVLDSNYQDGHVEPGNSLLLYCIPIPVLENSPKDEAGEV